MHREAAEAPAAIARQLQDNAGLVEDASARLRQRPPRAIVTCARGSSDHAATYARYLFEMRLGILTSSAFPSIRSVYGTQPDLRDTLYLVISQSGHSPDLVANARAARDDGATVMAMVNDLDSPLAASADLTLPLHAGPERSVAATKSFLAALSAIAQLTAAWTGDRELLTALDRLPEQLEAAWSLDWSAAVTALQDAHSAFVIGRGPGFAVAQEAALKFKETCALHAEAFSAAEVRHGPMALVQPGFPVLFFSQQDASRDSSDELIEAFSRVGARILAAGTRRQPVQALPVVAPAHPLTEPLLQAQSFYRMVNALAIRRGRDPDRPPHLRKVTETL